MSITRTILSLLLEPRFRYKGVHVSMIGLPAFDDVDIESIHRAISRLCKKKYIIKSGNYLKLSNQGEHYAYSLQGVSFSHSLTKNQPKNLIFMFDIKESRRKERNALRKHLKDFHYKMIQQSVWAGPSPLPKEFLEYLQKTKLMSSVKIFKLAKGYIFKK